MFYCEKCNVTNEQNVCAYCGKKNLRAVQDDDFCFLTEVAAMFGEMFCGILEQEQIGYSALPAGNGMRSQFALKLENLRIYVVYEHFNRAKDLLVEMQNNIESLGGEDLKANVDKIFVLPRNVKKMCRILNLENSASVLDVCADMILNADRIINRGRIIGCIHDGDYLFVYKEDILLFVNSATYELITAKKVKVDK